MSDKPPDDRTLNHPQPQRAVASVPPTDRQPSVAAEKQTDPQVSPAAPADQYATVAFAKPSDPPAAERNATVAERVAAAARPKPPAAVPSLDERTQLDPFATVAQNSGQRQAAAEFNISVPGYEILKELGRGGMGVVYQARHLGLDRPVALKMILSAEFADATDVERFRTEAVQLARAHHPNIVQIYEVGDYEGRPFFAMEFLGGGSLAGKIEGGPLPARDAARLIATLAEAMASAHEKGIVHRDLKPGNVLIGEDAPKSDGLTSTSTGVGSVRGRLPFVAKIADFGLVKVMGDSSRTGSGTILGTPCYMAPEQAMGSKDIGPAADLYALGVILYECLTGKVPFVGATPIDTIRLVITEEPTPPSKIASKVPRDLETICLKCLEKEPRKRYESGQALADDLHAFLEGAPIKARPVGTVERAIKWAKRRPALAALAATVALSAAALAAGGVWFNINVREQRDIAREQRDEADRQRQEAITQKALAEEQRARAQALQAVAVSEKQRAEANEATARREKERAEANAALAEARFQQSRKTVDQYFTEISEDTLFDEPGMEPLRKKLLGQAKGFYAAFVKEKPNDPAVRGDYARGLFRLAELEAGLEGAARGVELLKEALATFEQLAAEVPGDATYLAEVARTHSRLGSLYRDLSRVADAEAAGAKAIALWDQLAQASPTEARYQVERARSQFALANLYLLAHKMPEARKLYDTVLIERQRFVAADPDSEANLRDLAATWTSLAALADTDRDWARAEAASAEARAILTRLVAVRQNRTRYRHDLARNQLNLGLTFNSSNRPQQAVEAYNEAIGIWDRLRAGHPDVKEFRVGLGNAYFALSKAQAKLKQPSADETLRQAGLIREALAKEHPETPAFQADELMCVTELAERRRVAGQFPEAFRLYETVVPRFDALVKANPLVPRFRTDLAKALLDAGRAQLAGGELTAARQLLSRAIKAWSGINASESASPESQVGEVDSCRHLGDVELAAGKPTEAEVQYFTALERATRFWQGQPPAAAGSVLALTERGRARALTALGDTDGAAKAWNAAAELDRNTHKDWYKLYRQTTAARTPNYEQAVAATEAIAKGVRQYGQALCDCARVFVIAAASAAADETKPPAERAKLAEAYGKRAVELLHDARAVNFYREASNRVALSRDAEWQAVRARKDGQQLLADVAPK